MKSWRTTLMVGIITLLTLHLWLYDDRHVASQNPLLSTGYSHTRKQFLSTGYPDGKQFKTTITTSQMECKSKTLQRSNLGNSVAKDILARLNEATPKNNVTWEMYERSFLCKGNAAKLRKVFRDAIVDKTPISMATIGGSVSAGGGIMLSCAFPCLYMEIVAKWLEEVFGVHVDSRNVAMGGANSEYYAHCLEAHVAMETTHIIIGEFATNDRLSYAQPGFKDMGRPLEELIRNVKQRENVPAFILADFVDNRLLGSEVKNSHICSFDLEQQYYKPLLEYYDITGVSLFNLVCPVNDEQQGFHTSDIISYDYFHPSHLSHHYIAIILIRYFASLIKEVLNNLNSFPLDPTVREPNLPPPFFNRTWIYKPSCATNKRHLSIMSYTNLTAIEINGFHKYVVSTSLRRFSKFEVMEYRKDVFDGYTGGKSGDWITLELVAPYKPPGRVQEVLSLGYINCEFCNETVISVWVGTRRNPFSPVFNFTTFKYSPGTIIVQVDDIDLSAFVNEGQRFNVTVMLNGEYDFILHAAMIAWKYI